jgi:hypothetical protein
MVIRAPRAGETELKSDHISPTGICQGAESVAAGLAIGDLEGHRVRRPAITLRLGSAETRRAVDLRIETTERVALVARIVRL